jgi:16S rRNA (guanine(966)-N(2))-methyltransferase RsmD
MKMRIVAGHFRSRTLLSVRDLDLRPTSDRLRETLFNILGERVAGSSFIDLFAGTGAVGIEALSRGASHVIFVEKHEATVDLIRKNLHALGVPQGVKKIASADYDSNEIGAAEVLHTNVGAALKKFAAGGVRADLIFADPPYAEKRLLESSLKFIGDSEILNLNGQFMAEHSSRISLPEVAGKLRRTRVLAQGDSAISFFGF